MGEYWYPINVTRKEWMHPHAHDEGLKWGEWTRPTSKVMKLIGERWSREDTLLAVSDYGGTRILPFEGAEWLGRDDERRFNIKRPDGIPSYDDARDEYAHVEPEPEH